MSKNLDLRIMKTKKLIKDSFLELLDKQGLESITINDIAETAQINRSTLYLHYSITALIDGNKVVLIDFPLFLLTKFNE